MTRVVFLLLLSVALAPAAHGMQFEPVESIRAAAVAAVAGGAADAEASVDAALRLPRCAGGLHGQAANAGTVEVRCQDAGGWRLFVPVRARRSQQVLVLTRNVAAGEVIAESDFVVETRDTGRVVGAALGEPAAAVGRSARRMLAAGSVLGGNDLVTPRVVRRGDSVMLVSRDGPIEIRMQGRALADAGIDDRVTVENSSSRRVVQGRVSPAGEILVGR